MAKKNGAGGMGAVRLEMQKLIAEISEMPVKEVKDDAKLSDDLGIDSMKALEVVATIEKKLKIVIPEGKIPTLRTPGDIYALVEKQKRR